MTSPDGIIEKRKSGRPTKNGQMTIRDEIRKFFNRGLTIEDTCRRTSYNRKTVTKYFDMWTDQILKEQDKEITEREKDAKFRSYLCYNQLICNEFDVLDFIDDQINASNNMQIKVHLLSKRTESVRTIINLRDKIDTLAVTPTTREMQNPVEEEKKK